MPMVAEDEPQSASAFLGEKESASSFLGPNQTEFAVPIDGSTREALSRSNRATFVNPVGPESTTFAKPQTPEQAKQFTRPVIGFTPYEIKDTDSKPEAVGKEVLNILGSTGSQMTSPAGAALSVAGVAAPLLATASFAPGMVKTLGEQVVDTHKNWDKYTPNQRAIAVTDMAATGVFLGLMAHGTARTLEPASTTAGRTAGQMLKAGVKAADFLDEPINIGTSPIDKIATVAPLTAEALKQTIEPKGEQNASGISKATEVHGDVLAQPVEGTGEMPLAQGSGGIQPQAEGGIPEPAQAHTGTPETPLNPGGALKDLPQELQDKSNSVQDAMRAEYEALKAKEVKPSGQEEKGQEETNVLNPTGAVADQTTAPVAEQKYKIGNNPQTHTLVEKLPQTESEKLLEEQPVKVKNDKTGEVQTVMESDLTPVKERAPSEKPAKRDLNAELKDAGLDPSSFKNAAQKREALKRNKAIIGMGGAIPEEFQNRVSELKQLTQAVTDAAASDSPLPEKVRMIDRARDVVTDAKQAVADRFERMKAIGGAMWDELSKRKPWTDEKEAVGNWTYANQKADFEARQFAKAITKEVPDKLRREAMTNWIQADGDEALLKQRADASKGSTKRGYLMALELTPGEKSMARNFGEYFEAQLRRGQEAGILESGIENYVNQVWKQENPVGKALKYDFSPGKLQPNFKFAKRRIFDSYFEGEQLGYKPATKDIGALISVYDQAFNKSIAARGFLKELHRGTASDGRPLVEVSGSGRIIPGEEGKPGTLLITPRSKAADIGDYRVIDHPAMRGWKWVQTLEDGSNVIMQGQLLVHPEAYTKLRNRLQSSAWRTWTVGGIQPGKIVLGTQSAIKQTMLSVSGFHQVQETLHALGHRVNPANLEKIDFDNPTVKGLVTHGLQLADYHAMEMFGEGLASGSLLNKIPVIGKRLLKPYTEWLFQDYIPRLKLTMATHALERNIERYQGKLSRDQILELTSEQANAAFGELNYRYMGRNPNLQDTLRAFLLAPDFLEARARFVGQSIKPFGKEQLVALGLLALSQYMTARIFNKTLDDDYHWNPKDAFTYFYKGKRYSLRTVPGDIIHLVSDPRNFAFNRLSPSVRSGMEAITMRDERGIKRDVGEVLKDIAKLPVPISMKIRDDQTLWEAFMNSLGVREYRYTASNEIGELSQAWKKENVKAGAFQETYDAEKDQYRSLRLALDGGDVEAAQKAYDKLKATIAPAKIHESIRSHYDRPFAGSKANESKFYATLSDDQKKKFQEAKAEHRSSLNTFNKLKK